MVFAFVDSADGEEGTQTSFPWIIFIPLSCGIFIPFTARKHAALKIQGRRNAQLRIAIVLTLVTVIFLASVSYIGLKAY